MPEGETERAIQDIYKIGKSRTYKKILTNSPACGIVIGRMEELRSFFYAQIYA